MSARSLTVERFFVSIITRWIRRGAFETLPALEATIREYLALYNRRSTLFGLDR